MTEPSKELVEMARLTPEERTQFFMILQQWSRNAELQATKATEWLDRRNAEFGERVARECADECDLLHQVHDGKRIARCGAMIRDKFGLPAKAVPCGEKGR